MSGLGSDRANQDVYGRGGNLTVEVQYQQSFGKLFKSLIYVPIIILSCLYINLLSTSDMFIVTIHRQIRLLCLSKHIWAIIHKVLTKIVGKGLH